MVYDVGSRHAVTVGAFGNRDNDPFPLKYPIDPRNPPVAVSGDSADRLRRRVTKHNEI